MTIGFFHNPLVRAVPQRRERRDETTDGSSAGKDGDRLQRLVIVSNRVADLRASSQSGGLAVGLADALKERGGVWFGWDGKRFGTTGDPVETSQVGKVTCVGMPISARDFSDYYLGFANSTLWPLFHYRLDLVDYDPAHFAAYMRVNEAFARQLQPFLQPDDLIWIHDYHLLPLARCLRRLGCTQRIGHFQHIPFPPPDLFAAAPHHRDLVEALFYDDLLGFQTQADVDNLKSYLRTLPNAQELPGNRFRLRGRTVRIQTYPIGIDATGFSQLARISDPTVDRQRLQLKDCARIIGVDRLDYSKGLPEKFKAMELLLSNHQDLCKRVNYLQIAPPTRSEVDAYAEIRVELEHLTGSVNGRFGDFDWTPIQLVCKPMARRKLAPLLRHSKVGFVTPLRDGMNLVAKEYVAAQNPDDPGVLVLSKFAGAAENMREALIVNPYNISEMAEALHQALTMPLRERRARHRVLLNEIMTNDAAAWLNRFLDTLVDCDQAPSDERANQPERRGPARSGLSPRHPSEAQGPKC
ncbi:trehalose-6-phosphate synthase [Pararhodobacter sp. SW119]|uniref:alpha,alpha-trehalose-phosphate synthase (UDP-forming) n=1 Tax=Pararhodobacter sp. SW119 TaxID=2780075 RepID=UPI001FD834FA|nr:trehalose-6-phosphate synthase [Pararhodobacter sp. SW119]